MYLPDADRNRKTKTRIISLRQLTDLCVCGAVLVPVWSAGNGGVLQGPGLWIEQYCMTVPLTGLRSSVARLLGPCRPASRAQRSQSTTFVAD